jgi:sugar phosphate permease
VGLFCFLDKFEIIYVAGSSLVSLFILEPPFMNNEVESCQQTPRGWVSVGLCPADYLPSFLTNALSYRWLVFAVLAGGYVLVYFHRLCPAVVAVDMMTDLKTGGALLGLLGSAYFYPYALMQIPAGLLADSWGARRTVTLFTMIAFMGALVVALAPNVTIAILGRIIVGLGVSMLFVPTMKILTEWFRPHEFARMTGILLAMGGLGSLVSATPLALVTGWFGWRMAFVAVAGLTFVLALLVWLIVRDRPADMGWSIPGKATVGQTVDISLADGVKQVLASGNFWLLAGWFFFQSAVFFSFAGLWGGPYLNHVYSLDRAAAGQVLSMLAVGLIVGSPMQTWFSSRVCKGRKPVLILSSVVTSGITCLLVFSTAGLSLNTLSLICFLMGMFTSASVVIGFSATKELFPVQIAGTSIGLINLFPFAGGAVFQPVLGWILQGHEVSENIYSVAGYQSAFVVLLCCGLTALCCAGIMRETMKQEPLVHGH